MVNFNRLCCCLVRPPAVLNIVNMSPRSFGRCSRCSTVWLGSDGRKGRKVSLWGPQEPCFDKTKLVSHQGTSGSDSKTLNHQRSQRSWSSRVNDHLPPCSMFVPLKLLIRAYFTAAGIPAVWESCFSSRSHECLALAAYSKECWLRGRKGGADERVWRIVELFF